MSDAKAAALIALLAILVFGFILTRPATVPDIVYDYDCSDGAHLAEANC